MLTDLLIHDMRLVFIDDGGTSCKPISLLPTGYQLYAGVRLRPNSYRHAATLLTNKLAELNNGIREFHSTEIVNPRKESAWRGLDMSDRVSVVWFLADILDHCSDRIYYCHMNDDQFPDILCRIKNKCPGITGSQKKETLLKAFASGLIQAELGSGTTPIRLVADSDKSLGDTIKIQEFDESLMVDGAIIYADSMDVPGLQLADFAVYMINRIFHVTERNRERPPSQLDIAIKRAYDILQPKLYDMLGS